MDEKNSEMVKMWEQMGSSTGSMLGRFIGLGAQMSLDVFNNVLVMPNKGNASIRAETWGKMGQDFGKSMGEFIGTGMDMLVKNVESNVVQPMSEMEKNKTENNQ